MTKKLYLLNSSILTAFGVFDYKPIDLVTVRVMIAEESEVISAIGHQVTAETLSELLGRPVRVNRMSIVMQAGDKAIVFKLKHRLEEYKVLTKEEMKDLEYELGVLERLS
ncbi:MAG: DUF1874 domain-containing protein [Spirosomataceae bacterium]